jgi:hypothetical protein
MPPAADMSPDPLSERARQASKIASEPENYKICEGCDSIVARRVHFCPNCHGYRFNENPQSVIDQAILLGGRERTSVVSDDLI